MITEAGDTMTDRQRRFADEYLIDCNASRAYLAAYPRVKSSEVARKNGSRLLTYADVRRYIDEQMEVLRSRKVADAQEVLEYLTRVLRGESIAQIVVVEGDGLGGSSARAMDKTPDEKERLKAAELLGKRLNLFTESVQLSGAMPQIILAADGSAELEDGTD